MHNTEMNITYKAHEHAYAIAIVLRQCHNHCTLIVIIILYIYILKLDGMVCMLNIICHSGIPNEVNHSIVN